MTVNNVAMNTGIQVPVQVPDFLLSWVFTIPRSGIAGLYGNSTFNFLKDHQLYHFTFSPAIPKFSISPHPHKHLFISFFDNSNLNGCEVLFYCDFDLHFY